MKKFAGLQVNKVIIMKEEQDETITVEKQIDKKRHFNKG